MTWPPPCHPKVAAQIEKLRTVWADRTDLGFDTVYRNNGTEAVVLVWSAGMRIDARTIQLEEV